MEKGRKSNIKNIKVNKSSKRIIVRGISLITAAAITVGVIIAYQFRTKKDLKNNMNSIISYYGEDSNEAKIINYLDLAIQLNNLKLDDYKYTNELDEKFNISSNLSEPEEISSMIKKYKKFNELNKSELEETYDFIVTTIYLKQQKKLINKYVNDKGYDIVHRDLNNSLKEYASEEYNLDMNNQIYFGYIFEKSDGSETATISYKEPYNLYMCIVDDRKLKNGVCTKNSLEKTHYKEISDDEKMEKYVSALTQAKNLKIEVDEKNIYNEKSEKKLKR